jgi:hypothetical protein
MHNNVEIDINNYEPYGNHMGTYEGNKKREWGLGILLN